MARIELIDDSPSPSPTQTRRPRKDGTARKNPVGGSVAASMKRGMQVRTEEPAWRAYVLGAVALALLIALNWAWVARIARHVAAAGGWSEVVDRGRRAVVRWLEPAHLRDEV